MHFIDFVDNFMNVTEHEIKYCALWIMNIFIQSEKVTNINKSKICFQNSKQKLQTWKGSRVDHDFDKRQSQ